MADLIPNPVPQSLIDRFWQRVERAGDDECWLWIGYKGAGGYGRYGHYGKNISAHRLSYAIFKGPIPEGLVVCHSCDNPPCCNPAHLWVGTIAENTLDMDRKGRRRPPVNVKHGSDHPGAKLTNQQAIDILFDSRGMGKIAKEYGCSSSLISSIKTRKAYKNLVIPESRLDETWNGEPLAHMPKSRLIAIIKELRGHSASLREEL